MKVQFIVLKGLAISVTLLFLFIPANGISAIEYSSHTNNKYNLYFEYPSYWFWKTFEETSRFGNFADIMISDWPLKEHILIDFDDDSTSWTLFNVLGLEKSSEIILQSTTSDTEKEYKIIEEPFIISIDGKESATFLFTSKDKYAKYYESIAIQYWITPLNGVIYHFRYLSPMIEFDRQDNTEIRDHFIDSIKFLNNTDQQNKTSFN